MIRVLLFIAGMLAAMAAFADEATIRKAVESRLGVRVEGIRPGPIPGLFEVRFRSREGYRVIYSDAAGRMVIVGNIYDTENGRNLTEERVRKLSAIDFRTLPLDLAVRIRRGNGKRTLVMFSDPYCPACRQFEQTLRGINDITIHVFMYPVIRPERADHSRSVWCSADRAKAWLELAASETPKVPTASPTCANPVDKVLALGQSLGVGATPTIFFANGERMSGGLSADRLESLLDEVASGPEKSR
jgi:thiol:disulfide interchange protein DsbC